MLRYILKRIPSNHTFFRPIDAADCGLRFAHIMGEKLTEVEAKGHIKPMFKEAWLFSACLSLLASIPWTIPAPSPLGPCHLYSSGSGIQTVPSEGASGFWDLGLPGEWFVDISPHWGDFMVARKGLTSSHQTQELRSRLVASLGFFLFRMHEYILVVASD